MSKKDIFKSLKGEFLSTDAESLQKSFARHLESSLAKDDYSATRLDVYKSLAYTVRDRLVERWIATQQTYYDRDVKRVYYLSLEFLLGRVLENNLVNLNILEECQRAMHELEFELEEISEQEWDAGLGNGGLGRLAACFLDSMATHELPAYGYGIRYEYGIFSQKIQDGYQVETPDNWLRYENPWEIARPEYLYPIQFYGRVHQYKDANGTLKTEWLDSQGVMAMAYDIPIPGYCSNTVNNLRLWEAKSTREFDLSYFNRGDYIKAVEDKQRSETISKVLYPNDNIYEGRELRLKQEYFFVSATLQDAIRRYKKTHDTFDCFSDKVAVQLNDTHPAIAIPELMRVLVDIECLSWEKAWEITINTFGYTNHTILPEALETWSISLIKHVLPRHLQIIYEINRRFLEEVARRYPNDDERLSRMSLIEEGEKKKLRMAHLAIVGSHSTNGVAELHTELLKSQVFKDFFEFYPDRFNNKTNGITPRRWSRKCNPELSRLISKHIGDGWLKNLDELKKLIPLSEDEGFRKAWRKVKIDNKQKLADYIQRMNGLQVDVNSIFDCHVKRIHEYKRQLLNILHVITLYNRIKNGLTVSIVQRTIIFGGKAAPGYYVAKLIIKLINSVAEIVNNDPKVSDKLKVVFLSNYSVSLAELIIPATDISEHISTAGTEASGTSNMKFALNGALTIGTLDGANIEIMKEVGNENIFIFGLTAQEVADHKRIGYNPLEYYHNNTEIKTAIDMMASGYFSPSNPSLFMPIVDSLLQLDQYMIFADFSSYLRCQEEVGKAYKNQDDWAKKSIYNVANMGKFSSDRTISEYAKDIWGVESVPIYLNEK
jgi:glycogen phosphorylase